MTSSALEVAQQVTDSPRSLLIGISAQAKFGATAALRFATQVSTGYRAALSLCVFPPAGNGAQEAGQPLASLTLHGASRFIANAGVELIAEHTPSDPSTRFVQLARVHDLTVLDASAAGTSGRSAIVDALFDSGRPVFVIPRHGGKPIAHRVAIAWDGSARAARAVKDALPFLAAAELIVAVTVSGEKDLSRMAPGADLAAYLVRHGIRNCKLATLTARRADVAERIRLFVAEEDIDLIVMGAFVHSPLREAILGGVTRSLLDHAPVPLFMSH